MSGVPGVIDLSVWQLALALGLVAVIAVVSVRQSLGLERVLLIGSVRTVFSSMASASCWPRCSPPPAGIGSR